MLSRRMSFEIEVILGLTTSFTTTKNTYKTMTGSSIDEYMRLLYGIAVICGPGSKNSRQRRQTSPLNGQTHYRACSFRIFVTIFIIALDRCRCSDLSRLPIHLKNSDHDGQSALCCCRVLPPFMVTGLPSISSMKLSVHVTIHLHIAPLSPGLTTSFHQTLSPHDAVLLRSCFQIRPGLSFD
jgi:hypothetical protein